MPNSRPARTTGRLATLERLLRERRWESLRANLERNALPRWLFYQRRLVFSRLDEIRRVQRQIPGFTVRFATPEDEPLLRQVRDHRQGYAHMFARGDACVLCTAGERGAAFFWVEMPPVHVSKPNACAFQMEPGTGWSYAVEIHPEFRMRGAFVRLSMDGIDRLRERGIRALYTSMPEDENQISLRSHGNLGFRIFCRYRVTRLLGVARWSVSWVDGREESGFGGWRGAYREIAPADLEASA